MPKKYVKPSSGSAKRRRYMSYMQAASSAANLIGSWWKKRGAPYQAARIGKKGKSGSRASTRNILRLGQVEQNGTGGQLSKYVGPKGVTFVKKSSLDTVAPEIYVSNAAGQLLSTVGTQNASVIMSCAGKTDYNNVSSTTNIYRYFLDKVIAEVDMVNCYLSNCRITIYDVIARKDIATAGINTPLLGWAQGDIDESKTNHYKVPGSTPWQVELFNSYYKVMQVTNVTLGAGGQHTHRVNLSPQKLITGPYGAYTTCYANISYFTMVVISGQPANDTTTQSSVSLGAGGINYVTREEHHWKQLQNTQAFLLGSNSLATSFGVAEQVVNVGGSTISANALG